MMYIPHGKPKKRKRDINPVDHPKEALELLFDRLSVWQAVAELGEDNGVAGMLAEFWNTLREQ